MAQHPNCNRDWMYDISLSEQECWERVFVQEGFGVSEDDYEEDEFAELSLVPACLTCGETGVCGYDEQGRPMFHTDATITELEIAS